MRSRIALLITLVCLVIILPGCDFAGDVIEFTFWSGVVAVAVVAAIIWLVLRSFKRR